VGGAIPGLGDRVLARRGWWARKGLLGIELHIIVEVLEGLVWEAIGELFVNLLSNDCVSFPYTVLLLANTSQSGDWFAMRGHRSDVGLRYRQASACINHKRRPLKCARLFPLFLQPQHTKRSATYRGRCGVEVLRGDRVRVRRRERRYANELVRLSARKVRRVCEVHGAVSRRFLPFLLSF